MAFLRICVSPNHKKWKALPSIFYVITDVTWNADDESPTASVTGQSRGALSLPENSYSVEAAPPCQSPTLRIAGIPSN
ncbi:MAG: hypothetical protein ACK5VA_17265 [Pseudanabaena sp.]|jgi:hypothetical protein